MDAHSIIVCWRPRSLRGQSFKQGGATMCTRVYASVLVSAVLGICLQPALAFEAGDIIVRIGPTMVDPNGVTSETITLNGNRLPGAKVNKVDANTQLGVTGVYMFKSWFGLELLAATPFNHTIKVNGLEGLGIRRVGKTKQLPPTLSALFYPLGFTNPKAKLQPYVGVGLNYTIFWKEEASGQLREGLAQVTGVDEGYDMDLDNSFGLAARAGIDFLITDNIMLQAGLWYIDIETEAEFEGRRTGTRVKAKSVEIDPWVYTIGVGYRF